jgi:hypothetical protein
MSILDAIVKAGFRRRPSESCFVGVGDRILTGYGRMTVQLRGRPNGEQPLGSS